MDLPGRLRNENPAPPLTMKLRDVLIAGFLFLAAAVGAVVVLKKSPPEAATAKPHAGASTALTAETKPQPPSAEALIKEWMRQNFADPDASIANLSEPVAVLESDYRSVTVRARNKMGGWVFEYLVARFQGSAFREMLTAEQFVDACREAQRQAKIAQADPLKLNVGNSKSVEDWDRIIDKLERELPRK